MSDTTGIEFWYLICTVEGCELADLSFPIVGDEAECGGCNTVYFKTDEGSDKSK